MTRTGYLAFLLVVVSIFLYKNNQSASMTLPIPVTELPTPIKEPEKFFVTIDKSEFECMQKNMYFEARGEKSDKAMIAVGYAVINRVHSKEYKSNTICGIVTQANRDASGKVIRNKCHFSWYCDDKPDVPNLNNALEKKAWDRAGELAALVIRKEIDNPIGNAIMYHATYVKPKWRKHYVQVAVVGSHIFYSSNKS
jgi:spore germination cell wall hydrolase CwlJ-like protein